MPVMDRAGVAPAANIRRFDIFAEWNRLEASEKKHFHADDARAFGIAVAKIVAARKFSGYEPHQLSEYRKQARKRQVHDEWWRHFGSSDEYQRKIVRRMGEDFYRRTFAPTIRGAFEQGMDYNDIRDTLRSEWNEKL